MEIEQKLADMIFGADPLKTLEAQTDENFLSTDRKQFGLFYSLLLKRTEERLSSQFGACLGLLKEKWDLESHQTAKDFVSSPEFRLVREDLTDTTQTSESRFEIAFLNFILRTHESHSDFLDEFSDIFLRELTMNN